MAPILYMKEEFSEYTMMSILFFLSILCMIVCVKGYLFSEYTSLYYVNLFAAKYRSVDTCSIFASESSRSNQLDCSRGKKGKSVHFRKTGQLPQSSVRCTQLGPSRFHFAFVRDLTKYLFKNSHNIWFKLVFLRFADQVGLLPPKRGLFLAVIQGHNSIWAPQKSPRG